MAKARQKNSRGRRAGQAQRVETAAGHGLLRKLLLIPGMLLLISGIAYAGVQLGHSESFPLRSIQIEGGLRQLDTERLQQVVSAELEGNFFSVDIRAIQRAVMDISWVEHVSIRRKWPDVLRIRVTEQRPLARWGEQGLLNERGEWFGAGQQGLEHLPQLDGPDGYHRVVAQRYRELAALLQPAGLRVKRLRVNQRRSWVLELDNGITLKLGRERHDTRVRRFARIYPEVMAKDVEKIEVVDLRYTNGLAVRWTAQPGEEKKTRGS